MLQTILLLILSNIFMTYAWYGHLKTLHDRPLWLVIGVSWGIAFFEYCLQVPANRIGAGHLTIAQLKVLQEIISIAVFGGFLVFFFKQSLKWDHLWAAICLVGAAYFMFREGVPGGSG